MKKTTKEQKQTEQEINNAKNETPEISVSDQQLQQITDLTNDLQRTRADFENFRKQTEIQKQQAVNIAKNATVLKFLPLLDDLERAISVYPEQLSPLTKKFEKTLNELGLELINSNKDTDFNPELHDAVFVEGEGDSEIIAETMRTGYVYEGQVIRPAMVKVVRK